MTRQEYDDLKDLIGIRNKFGELQNTVTKLMGFSPELADMTLIDLNNYFYSKVCELENQIQEKLNVK